MIENKSPIRNISSRFEFFLSYHTAIQIIYVIEADMARYGHSLGKTSYFLRLMWYALSHTLHLFCVPFQKPKLTPFRK